MKVQLITDKLTAEEKKEVLLASNNIGTALCNQCLKRISNVKEATMEHDIMFCSQTCAREFRTQNIIKEKGIRIDE